MRHFELLAKLQQEREKETVEHKRSQAEHDKQREAEERTHTVR